MLRHYLDLIQNGWRTIATVIVLACIVSVTMSLTTTPIYRATTSFIIYPTDNLTSSRDVVSSLSTLEQRSTITTYADIMASQRVYLNTQQSLQGLTIAYPDYRATVEIPSEANIFNLNVDGPDPNTAAFLANQIGQRGISLISSIYTIFDIDVLDEASAPATPILPRPLLSLAIAFGIGVVLGAALVISSHYLRQPLEAIRERLSRDPVTGAYKREYFTTLIDRRLGVADEAPLSLGLIELSGFKEAGAELPRPVRDEMLGNVYDVLNDQLRGEDVIGRWSDTTFAIMLPGTKFPAAAMTLWRLLNSLPTEMSDDAGLYKLRLLPNLGMTSTQGEEIRSKLLGNLETALELALKSEDNFAYFPEPNPLDTRAIRERINSDPESGAYKRKFFASLVEQQLLEHPEQNLALGLIDLDGLKELDRALSNKRLIDLLSEAAGVFKEQLRGDDVLGRWSESGFAFLLPGTPPQPAAKTLLRVRKAFKDWLSQYSAAGVEVVATVGLTAREDDEGLDTLLENLEFALEKSKLTSERIFIYPVTLGAAPND